MSVGSSSPKSSGRVTLPEYTVPKSLFSRQAIQTSRANSTPRTPFDDVHDLNHDSTMTSKRRATSSGSSSPKSSAPVGLPQYIVPESLLLSRPTMQPSRGDSMPQAAAHGSDCKSKLAGKRKRTTAETSSPKTPSRGELPQYSVPNSLISPPAAHSSGETDIALNDEFSNPDYLNNPITRPLTDPVAEPSITAHSQQGPLRGAENTEHDVQRYSNLSANPNLTQIEEQLSGQSLDESPADLMLQAAEKDLGIRYDYFLGGLPENFFPTPAMTDAWGETPITDLTWNSTMPTAGSDGAVIEVAPERCDFVSDSGVSLNTHGTINTTNPLPGGETSEVATSASAEARLSHVLKAVNAAGFDSLDNVVLAYYTKSLKDDDDESLRQEQRLNRIRRLPVLLKELHLAAQGWGQWQRRSFHEQIIKSTEDILISELEDHLAARRPDVHLTPPYNCAEQLGPAAGGPPKANDEADIEDKLPNTWTLLTSLSTQYNLIASKHWQTGIPKLVGKLLAVGTELDS